jgi:hypothetical protein
LSEGKNITPKINANIMKTHAVLGLIVAGIVIGFVLIKNRWFQDRDPDNIIQITHTTLKDAVLVVDYSINYDHLSQAAALHCQPYQFEGEEVSVKPMRYEISVGLIPQKIYREMRISDGFSISRWDNEEKKLILTDVCGWVSVHRVTSLSDLPINSFKFLVGPSAQGVTNYHAPIFIPLLDSRYLIGRYQLVVEVQIYVERAHRGKTLGYDSSTLGWKSLTTKIPDQIAPSNYEWKQKRQLIKTESGGTVNIDKLVTVEIPANALLEDSEVRVDILLARGQAMTCLITKDIRGLPEELPLSPGKAVQIGLNYADLGDWDDLTMASRDGQQISAGLPGVVVNREQKTVTFQSMSLAYHLGSTYHLIVHAKKP